MPLSPAAEYRSPCSLAVYALCALLVTPACLREGRERALGDLEIGGGELAGVTFQSVNGLGHVRSLTDGQLTMWASAPVIVIDVAAQAGARRDWTVTVENCMPGAELSSDEAAVAIAALGGPRPTICSFSVQLPDTAGASVTAALTLAPPDAATSAPFRFAAMSDVQDGIATIHAHARRQVP